MEVQIERKVAPVKTDILLLLMICSMKGGKAGVTKTAEMLDLRFRDNMSKTLNDIRDKYSQFDHETVMLRSDESNIDPKTTLCKLLIGVLTESDPY